MLDDFWCTRETWLDRSDAVIDELLARFELPLFVKPATLGSSIGIGRADTEALLRASIDIAANFDRRILIEPAVTNGIEINCSVMGFGDQYEASTLEQPVSWDEFLSYEDKYLRGNEGMKSAERLVPAPISAELTHRIRETSIAAFKAVDGRGIARIDYLVRPDQNELFLNEINTMPGSLAFYLWREDGYTSTDLVQSWSNSPAMPTRKATEYLRLQDQPGRHRQPARLQRRQRRKITGVESAYASSPRLSLDLLASAAML